MSNQIVDLEYEPSLPQNRDPLFTFKIIMQTESEKA